MKNLFDQTAAREVTARIELLTPDAAAQWGRMSVAQMAAHCAVATETALGERNPPRLLVGRILGPIIKLLVLKDDERMQRNSPTAPMFVVADEREFKSEQTWFFSLTERFASVGQAVCITHPHAFFGRMTPAQWAVLRYKHADHHLRQFGV